MGVFLVALFSSDNDDGDILNKEDTVYLHVDNRFSPTSTKTVPKLLIADHTNLLISTVLKRKQNAPNSDNETIDLQ